MTGSPSLPPHLERFVRDQIVAGRFHSEGELIREALRLLEASSLAEQPFGLRSGPNATALRHRPGRPAGIETWESLPERTPAAGTDATPAPTRRSPRGLLADLRSNIRFDDIKDNRSEMWGHPHPSGPQ